MPALHHSDVTVRNYNGNVVANSNWSCLLISAPTVHWRVQPTAARRSGRFNKTHGLCAHCTCLSAMPLLSENDWKGTMAT